MSANSTDILLVSTHPRSGTHLLINSLCLNFAGVVFQPLRGQYPTLERLVMDHDDTYSQAWESYLNPQPGIVTVVKTHMTPSDIAATGGSGSGLSSRDQELFDRIVGSAKRLCIYRDGRDALLSWYHYMKEFGGGLPTDLPPRLAHCTPGEFIRMPNRYHAPIRATQPTDRNRVAYWNHHVESTIDEANTFSCSFEALRNDLNTTLGRLATDLGWEERRLSPLEHPPLVRPARLLVGKLWQAACRRMSARRHAKRGCHPPPSPAWARQGQCGTWQEQYRPEDIHFFDEWAGDTLARWGYPTGAKH